MTRIDATQALLLIAKTTWRPLTRDEQRCFMDVPPEGLIAEQDGNYLILAEDCLNIIPIASDCITDEDCQVFNLKAC